MKELKTIVINNLSDKPYFTFYTKDLEIIIVDIEYKISPDQNGMMVINLKKPLTIIE